MARNKGDLLIDIWKMIITLLILAITTGMRSHRGEPLTALTK
jgi:hypothetical protein